MILKELQILMVSDWLKTYFLEDSVWINFDEAIRKHPICKCDKLKSDFSVNQNKFVEDSNEEILPFYEIKEYKNSRSNYLPLEICAKRTLNKYIKIKREVANATPN